MVHPAPKYDKTGVLVRYGAFPNEQGDFASWQWSEFGAQPDLENSLGVLAPPSLVALSPATRSAVELPPGSLEIRNGTARLGVEVVDAFVRDRPKGRHVQVRGGGTRSKSTTKR